MLGTHQIRTLIGAADPIDPAAPPPRLSAVDLIARAEATEPAAPIRRAPRRLVLVAGAAAVVAAGAVTVLHPFTASTGHGPGVLGPPGGGLVLVPIAYQIDQDPPAAGEHLRAMAAHLADAPSDKHTGRYAYHHVKTWGDPLMSDDGGRYVLGFAGEEERWQLADGSGRSRVTTLPPEFPDVQSRDHWLRQIPGWPSAVPHEQTLPPYESSPPLPTDRAGLAALLSVRYGGGAVAKQVTTVYQEHVVPTRTRALILDILADVPGFRWRGQVTDRAGRPGVAITYEDPAHGQQSLLVFDARTGVLLAHEIVSVKPRRVSTYLLLLATDRTDN